MTPAWCSQQCVRYGYCGTIWKMPLKLSATILALVACVSQAAGATCSDLAKLALPSTTISAAEAVPAGPYTPAGSQAVGTLPAFCRVAGAIKPVEGSNIQFEVWMPASGWNGKFQGVGNGGFAGSISFSGLADAVKHGYAAASTDTGHHAGGTDATWALGHPETIADFGYRAIHETTEKGKAIV